MKELKIGEWYYRMMGYGGSASQYCCIRRKTEKKTASGMMSLFGGKDGGIRKLPICEIFEAVDECGVVHQVSANDLAANGSIGIGTLEEPRYGHVASIYNNDAQLLVEIGKYTRAEIKAAFPHDFENPEDETDFDPDKTEPMTDKQEEILRAAYAANCEKKKKKEEEAARKYAAEVDALREKYNYIPCPKTEEKKWLTVGEKRRNVLAVLKHEFPGVKFKAHTRNGSTSDSITVEYEDGPAYDKVMKVLDAFETTTYNAYEDIHEDCTRPAACVCGGFDYVFVHRNTTQDVYKFVHDYIMEHVGGATEECARGTAHKVCAKTDIPAGGYELEGLELTKACEWVLHIKAKADPQKPTPPDAPKGSGDGVEVTENKEKGGIEIRFPSIPSEDIRNVLKKHGYRWSKFSKCWWCKACDEARSVAAEVTMMWAEENKAA